MKKIFLVCIICMCLLCGCSVAPIDKTDTVEVKSTFVEIEHTGYWRVVYHKDTKVMYVVSDGSYNHGTFTLLVNADGTPMLYKGGD